MTQSTYPGAPSYVAGTLLYRGAEADVVLGRWQGLRAVFKVRKPLPYRLKVLDDGIRRQRTLREAEMLHRARSAGVGVPYVYHLDPVAATLVLEYVSGPRVKDQVSGLGQGKLAEVFRGFGAAAGRLHGSGLMHGDLTTANAILRGGEVVLVDFGLAVHSSKVEDHAVDLRLVKETLVGAHPSSASAALDALFGGYESEVGAKRAASVLKQLRAIERRGRYARMA